MGLRPSDLVGVLIRLLARVKSASDCIGMLQLCDVRRRSDGRVGVDIIHQVRRWWRRLWMGCPAGAALNRERFAGAERRV